MYFEQFFLGCLAHASYMLGSGGLAAVVDPQRDVDLYLEEAAAHGLRIAYVIETHLHADFVSGHRELAERTGAQIYLGATAGATFPHVPVDNGNQLEFGHCRLEFLETPGHTPESLCVLVSDLHKSPEPFAVLTGDTLFVGDVGRPDLAGSYTPQQLAELLYESVHGKLLRLPDHVHVYPAHGAGSLCGRNMSLDRSSTIGRERATNYALQSMSQNEFIRMLATDLPERPGYFSRDALRINAEAPDFTAETTEGAIHFHDWIGDGWAILFSHPKSFTPVCTTELGYMARLQPEFAKRNCKVIGLSVDPVSGHSKWAQDIEETQGHKVTFPMIGDPELKVSKLYDMLPANCGDSCEGRTAAANATVRTVFVIGPDKKIKLMLSYPMSTGRNFDEVLRVLDSMQLTARHKVATPVNWKQGDDVIILPSVADDEAKQKYPAGWIAPKPYLRIVPQPE